MGGGRGLGDGFPLRFISYRCLDTSLGWTMVQRANDTAFLALYGHWSLTGKRWFRGFLWEMQLRKPPIWRIGPTTNYDVLPVTPLSPPCPVDGVQGWSRLRGCVLA